MQHTDLGSARCRQDYRRTDPTELSSLAASYDNEALPLSIQLRNAPTDWGIDRIAADPGFIGSFTSTFVIKNVDADDGRASMPDKIIVRRVPAQGRDMLNTVLPFGFEAPGGAPDEARGSFRLPILRAE